MLKLAGKSLYCFALALVLTMTSAVAFAGEIEIPVNHELEAAKKAAKVNNADAKGLTFGVAVYKFDDTFVSMIRNAINESAAQFGVNVEIVDSMNRQPNQNDQVDQFLTKGVDALIINPVDRTTSITLINKAKADNIPVIFFNREPLPDALASYDKVWYVGAVSADSGAKSAELIVNYFNKYPDADKNNDHRIQYILLQGEMGQQDTALRSEHAIRVMTEAGWNPEELGRDTANWDKVLATNKMEGFISSIGLDRIEAIVSNNDDMALGAIEALKANGYNTGTRDKFIPVVGVDAIIAARDAMRKRELYGTILDDAQGAGDCCVRLAIAAVLDMPITKESIGYEITDGKYFWIPNTPLHIDFE